MKTTKNPLIVALAALLLPAPTLADVYFNATFDPSEFDSDDMDDKGQFNLARPAWKLPPKFTENFGEGNFFSLSDATSWTGGHSMRYNYAGSNSFCNTCGGIEFRHIKDGSHDGAKYFVVEDEDAPWGTNLLAREDPNKNGTRDGPRADAGKIVYNKSNNFSKWVVLNAANENATNDRLNLKLLQRGYGHASDDDAFFTADDKVNISKRCGVDGTVGLTNGDNDIHRRSDCDLVTGWLGESVPNDGVSPNHMGNTYRSIFMRYYLKPEISTPLLHQKLINFRAANGLNDNNGDACTGAFIAIVADFDQDGGDQLHVSGFHPYNDIQRTLKPGSGMFDGGSGVGLPADTKFERSEWHYVEYEFRAGTYLGDVNGCPTYDNDGHFKLWFSKADEAVAKFPDETTPTLFLENLALPAIAGGSGTHVSLWGNYQHPYHLIGSWYIDDVRIADDWGGPIPGTSTAANLPPPDAPAAN